MPFAGQRPGFCDPFENAFSIAKLKGFAALDSPGDWEFTAFFRFGCRNIRVILRPANRLSD
jgi:hypothetical protein